MYDEGERPAMDIRRALIVLGLAILAAGLAWPWLSRLGLGRLPGDIAIQRPGFSFYFPIVTCLIVSVVLTLLFWLLRK
jgi:membrane protein implicated in regulation of membrane protease activity